MSIATQVAAVACPLCWTQPNWCESFNKFGHDEGDDCVHTGQVAMALQEAGYYVKLGPENIHNRIIEEVGEMGGCREMLLFYGAAVRDVQVGYTDPRTILPPKVVNFLDKKFGIGEFFG